MLAMWILQPLLLLGAASAAIPPFPPHLVGNASAVAALLERVVPGASAHFEFEIVPAAAAGAKNAFAIADTRDGKIKITGTTASELTGGLGVSDSWMPRYPTRPQKIFGKSARVCSPKTPLKWSITLSCAPKDRRRPLCCCWSRRPR